MYFRPTPETAETLGMAGSRYLNVPNPSACSVCRSPLRSGLRAWWDAPSGHLECGACRPELSAPGASAQREGERRYANRDQRTRTNHPVVGGILMAARERPQHEQSWLTGAEGERRVGKMLEDLAPNGVRVVHDRAVLASKANIDHIAVSPTGIYVIDTKFHEGKRVELKAPLFGRARLRVGGRENTKLVTGMAKQVSTVREAIGIDVQVTPVVCFLAATWPMFGKSFSIDGVRVCGPKVLRRWLTRPGNLSPATVDETFRAILRHTRPA